MKRRVAGLLFAVGLGLSTPTLAPAQQNELISINAVGTAGGNGASGAVLGTLGPRASADGRFVVFESAATDLIPAGTTPTRINVFLRDRLEGVTTLISRNTVGTLDGNGNSFSPTITPNGRFIVFLSFATDLVTLTDANSTRLDLFRFDTCLGADTLCVPGLELVSVNAAGTASGNERVSIGNFEVNPHPLRPFVVSDDGNRILFASRATDLVAGFVDGNASSGADLYLRDMALGQTILLTGNAAGTASSNGRHGTYDMDPAGTIVVFHSSSTDLTDPPDTNFVIDIFIRELQTVTPSPLAFSLQVAQVETIVPGPTSKLTPGFNDTTTVEAVGVAPNGDIIVAGKTFATNHGLADPNGNNSDLILINTRTRETTVISTKFDGTQTSNGAAEDFQFSGGGYAWRGLGTDVVANPAVTPGVKQAFGGSFNLDGTRTDNVLLTTSADGTTGANADVAEMFLRGLFFAFGTNATNLTFDPVNGLNEQIFGETLSFEPGFLRFLLSIKPDGNPGDADSFLPYAAINPVDGTPTVTYVSRATLTSIPTTSGLDNVYASTIAPPRATLEVTKVATNVGGEPITAVKTGEEFVYRITLKNLGPDTATNVVLTDTLPTGATFVDVVFTPPLDCSFDAGTRTVTCTISALAPSSPLLFIFIGVTAPAEPGTITNSATADAAESDPVTSEPVTVTVNNPPVANPDSYTTGRDQTLTIAPPGVLVNDSDPDGDTLEVDSASVTQPANGSVAMGLGGGFTYTPNLGFVGEDTFTYRAKDTFGALSEPATVTITVQPPPVIESLSCEQGNLVVGGREVACTATVTVGGEACLGCTFEWTSNTCTDLTPTNPTTGVCPFGQNPINLNVCDPVNQCDNASTSVTVAANNPPVANPDGYTTGGNQPLTIASPGVLVNDSDPDGDTLGVDLVSVTQPANGGVDMGFEGGFTYVPNLSFSGPDTFTYRAEDIHGALSEPATVTITVEPLPVVSVPEAVAVPNDAGPVDIPVRLNQPSGLTVSFVISTRDGTAVAGMDYEPLVEMPVKIAAGETGTNVPVTILDNPEATAPRNFTLEIKSAENATVGNGTTTVTIQPPPPGISFAAVCLGIPSPSFPIMPANGDVCKFEGNGGGTKPFVFTVTLSHSNHQGVTVEFDTVDETAKAPEDYLPIPLSERTLRWPAGTNDPQTITVPVVADNLYEDVVERFRVELFNATDAEIADSLAFGVIFDDDPPPLTSIQERRRLRLLKRRAPVGQGATLRFAGGRAAQALQQIAVEATLELDTVSGLDARLELTSSDGGALAGRDYLALTDLPVVIPAGETTATVTLTVLEDPEAQAGEERDFFVDITKAEDAEIGNGRLHVIIEYVENLAPVIDAVMSNPASPAPAASTAGVQFTFTATVSDPEGDPLTFAWSGDCGSSSAPSPTLTCPIGVNTVTLAVGDGQGGPTTDSIMVTVTDYTVEAACQGGMPPCNSATMATISAGQAAEFVLTAKGVNDTYNAGISFACMNLPAFTTCTFMPGNSLPNAPPGGASITLRIQTTAPGFAQLHAPSTQPSQPPFLALFMTVPGLALFGLVLAGGRAKRRGLGTLCLLAVLLVMATMLAGCGGGDFFSGLGSPGTPTGSHSVTINAVGVGTLERSVNLTVVVQ